MALRHWHWAFGCALVLLVVSIHGSRRPDPSESAAFARWLVASGLWGVVSTVSIHLKGVPFGNIVSFSDGPAFNSTGTPYFYLTELDPTARDLAADDRCSFTISEASLGTCGKADAESPICSKITLSGKVWNSPLFDLDGKIYCSLATHSQMVKLVSDGEKRFAASALFSKHHEMPNWPKSHNFHFYKLEILDIFLIDFFGGPKPLTIEDYYAHVVHKSNGRHYQ
ncbi:protein CREG1 isoform X1 [Selaginella moellendorffii]|uniref:protein CREG1 isoform X1 n=1 Tax=Selaginella moellendorffii TaxID=88036 RepID=UPI000D1C401C|nr:protein CREG1 isoform X1 [Selaginella moellendorffii]|eukprot:XP_024524448.1 protein CREG1 isoform X1 [Selaginella moellendorffii]